MAGGVILDTRGWTGASVVYTHASGSATYAVTGDVHNAYTVAGELATWLDSVSRPWQASLTGVSWTPIASGARLDFSYTYASTSFTSIVGNATWLARMGSLGGAGAAVGTCSAEPASDLWDRWDATPGVRSRDGSYRHGSPVTAHRRPSIELPCTLAQAWAFDEGLRYASTPRRAYVYDVAGATWRLVTLGDSSLVHPDPEDATRMTATMEALG